MPISQYACHGPCNRVARQAWDAYDQALASWLEDPGRTQENKPAPPETPVAVGDPVWDGRCARMIRAAFTELDDLASHLAAGIDGYRPLAPLGPNGRAVTTPEGAVEALDELFGKLTEVEDDWREARHLPPRPHRARGGHARRLSIAFLLDELDDILKHPGSIQFGLATLSWQRRLRTMTKSDPTTKASPIRCPRCSERQVRQEDDGYFKCHSCQRLMTQDEHESVKQEQADEHVRAEANA
ncbi:hypothetical protein [Nonomuraea sp. NPDC050310]|uniref:hypothetical protein n=1 Tax=Nonomuraea sp. NPDC050310 TaxID=3154935 RepID=UPI0033E59951